MVVDQIIQFVIDNLLLVVIAGVGIFFVFFILKSGTRGKFKPIDRAEVERVRYIKRTQLNENQYFKWLYRGNKLLGRIDALKTTILESKKGNPAKERTWIYEMVIKPSLFGLKLTNPLGKKYVLHVLEDSVEVEPQFKSMVISGKTYFDYVHGVYYDMSAEPLLVENIKQDGVFRTDLESLAGIYFAKSQEQSTFSPEHAHEIAKKEMELQIEREKRSRLITGS